MSLKKLALISMLLIPITHYALADSDNDSNSMTVQDSIPVITLPVNIPSFGIITTKIQDSQRKIDAMRQILETENRILLVSAHPATSIDRLPRTGTFAKVFQARSGWCYLELTAIAAGKVEVLEYSSKNGFPHALVELQTRSEEITQENNEDDVSVEPNDEKDKQSARNKIKKLPLSKEDIKEILGQLDLLERSRPDAAEYPMLKRYIDLVLSLPWQTETTDNLDIKHAKEVLDRDHHGLDKIKSDILDFIAMRKLNPKGNGKILCLVGPPGTGKTSICKSIAESLGRKYERIALGGLRDEAEIRGHRRTYVGALPGRVIQAIKKAQSNNPVMVLDEIDKVGGHYHGDPTAALLELLDPEQNNAFYDNYLAVPFDVSKVMFIATANSLESIPTPLLDRMEIIELSGYTTDEKVHIAQKHVISKALKATGLQADDISIAPQVLERVITEYTREAGIRQLERTIKKLCAKAAREKIENNKKTVFTHENLRTYLDAPRYPFDPDDHKHRVGVAHGLAWTAVGGTTLDMEAVLTPGQGKIILTGKLGEVMQESAQAALSYAKSRAKQFGIDPTLFKDKDIHIHAPEGAVPKDGPSAGITILTAVVSAFTDKPVNGNYAMTGEINLHGDVMPIGGVKEKILAAKQQGYQNIIVPYKNKDKVEALGADLLKGVTIIYAKHADDVVRYVFNLTEGKSPASAPWLSWPFAN